MRKLPLLFLFPLLFSPVEAARPGFSFQFDSSARKWTIANGTVTAVFELTPSGTFRMLQAGLDNEPWMASATHVSAPFSFTWNGQKFDGRGPYTLVDQYTLTTARNGMRQVIALTDNEGKVRIELHLDLFLNQPVLRFRSVLTNLSATPAVITASDMLPMSVSDANGPFRVFRVNQWAVVPRDLDFQTAQTNLDPAGDPASILSGAHGTQVSWVALRSAANAGAFAGWEFNGRSSATVQDVGAEGTLQFSAPIDGIHHTVAPGAVFVTPAAFLGFFQGDWNEAGYRTQRFVETSLAAPAPDLQRFPYMSWDSWGYQENFDETVLKRNAVIAASMGVELFIVDLGWAKQLGNWYADPAKFPSGLKALSDYVHSLGMKFGLHLTPAEAAPDSPVLVEHPDWVSTEQDNYYGASSLCLSNKPAHDWVIQELIRVIDDYGVDWILQDGENMVKKCTNPTHTHDPEDSNYANAVEGIDSVVEAVVAARPNVSWENCENGGNMMTFKMVQNYVTSITNDGSGALGSREGAYGATYPMPPRFVDRYSPEDPTTTYNTRSYIFGGPWHLMDKLDQLTLDQLKFAASEIAAYKGSRGSIRNGKVYHIAPPGPGRIDAIESSYLSSSIVAIVTREGGDADSYTLKLSGVAAAAIYQVHFRTDTRSFTMTGHDLATTGVLVSLPDPQSAEIVYADRM